MADEVLRQGVQGISDIITKTGFVNTDFADVVSTMKGQGDALMGIGYGSGENRAAEAASGAVANPLLEDTSIEGATRILVNVAGDEKISLVEVDEAINLIKQNADPNVQIIHGISIDKELGDKIRVTVIATGFRVEERGGGKKVQSLELTKGGDNDWIPYEEWDGLKEHSTKRQDFLSPRNFQETDLDVPTVIRNKKFNSSEIFSGNSGAEGKAADASGGWLFSGKPEQEGKHA
jgi:cell division protein FtsZ